MDSQLLQQLAMQCEKVQVKTNCDCPECAKKKRQKKEKQCQDHLAYQKFLEEVAEKKLATELILKWQKEKKLI